MKWAIQRGSQFLQVSILKEQKENFNDIRGIMKLIWDSKHFSPHANEYNITLYSSEA